MHIAAIPEYPCVLLFATEIQIRVSSSIRVANTHIPLTLCHVSSALSLPSFYQLPRHLSGAPASLAGWGNPSHLFLLSHHAPTCWQHCRLISQVRNVRHGGRRDFPKVSWLRNDRAMMSARRWFLTSSQRTGRNVSFQTLRSFSI